MRREMRGADFCGDEHIVAPDPRSAQALADLAFVLISLRGVDVEGAGHQRLLDPTCAGSSTQFPGTQPDRGNFGAVGLDEMHRRYSDKPSSIMSPEDRAANIAERQFRAQTGDGSAARAANTVSGA